MSKGGEREKEEIKKEKWIKRKMNLEMYKMIKNGREFYRCLYYYLF